MTPRRVLLALAASGATSFTTSALSDVAAALSIWPASLDDALAHSLHDGEAEVQSEGSGGVLAAYSAQLPSDGLQASLHPFVRALKIDWVPASDVASSTFSRIFAVSDAFSRADAVGIHLQVEISGSDSREYGTGEIEQLHLTVEENVRSFLEKSLPGVTAALQLQQGFLTRSPCNLRAWERADVGPLFRATNDPSSPPGTICFASSFPFSSAQTRFVQAFCAESSCEPQAARSELERVAWLAPRVLSTTQPRIASISVANDGERVRVHFFQVHVSQIASHTIKIAEASPESGVVLVSSIRQLSEVFAVEYHALSLTGDVSSSGMTELSVAANTAPGALAASISGEGFHRRMELDLEISDTAFCKNEQSKVTVVLPLSHSVYADLDELRRLERFGHFQVLAFQKHIEIERPSSVSPQHVIALQIDMPASRRLHTELPIHLRYQAPSTTKLYRPAVVMSPEAFVYCSSVASASANANSKATPARDAASLHFEIWWHSTCGNDAKTTKRARWRRVSLDAPIHVQDVLTPVGFLPSRALVSSVTFASTCIAAIVLVWIAAKRVPRSDALASQWRPKHE